MPSATFDGPWTGSTFHTFTDILDALYGAYDCTRVRVALKLFIDGFRYFNEIHELFFSLFNYSFSALQTAQYSIKGIYVQLAGVVSGKVVPFAFVPPTDVDINEFLTKSLIPEIAQLFLGIEIVYKG